ncbi:MAG TPA: 2-amino-4-hydroxy-6-hydroxymethyldihydropteridine diphosphokinase [Alcanivoracaceae bacterium]|nr:2-amino-4-hydroxy-6-hydroxymethyldihydropteridine diphosphokinase [Alcanivoracaceae bacterium]
MGTLVYIGLGSNLDNPAEQVLNAVQQLHQLPHSQILKCSSLYSSAPIGPQDQPSFINAVALLQTELPPIALLDALQALELQAGRIRTRHWGERTLDLDILLYGQEDIEHERLLVPHPHMHARRFVLLPLLEIAPNASLPHGEALKTYLPATSEQEIWLHSGVDLASLLGI